MNDTFATWDLSRWSISFGGFPIDGFQADDAWEITPAADDWDHSTGALGSHVRSALNNNTREAVMRLQATSPANSILNTIRQDDLASGAGTKPFIAKDRITGSKYNSARAYIKGPPVVTGSAAAPVKEWTIVLPNCVGIDLGAPLVAI